jgi:hypothetical protein
VAMLPISLVDEATLVVVVVHREIVVVVLFEEN